METETAAAIKFSWMSLPEQKERAARYAGFLPKARSNVVLAMMLHAWHEGCNTARLPTVIIPPPQIILPFNLPETKQNTLLTEQKNVFSPSPA